MKYKDIVEKKPLKVEPIKEEPKVETIEEEVEVQEPEKKPAES